MRYIDSETFSSKDGPYVAMEYLPFGSLADQSGITIEETVQLLDQGLSALGHIHSHDMAHRDIKPENILLFSKQPFRIKLADFGLAQDVSALATQCGTPRYAAPEIWQGTRYTPAVDIWSLGVVAFEYAYTLQKCEKGCQPSDWPQRVRRAVENWESGGLIDVLRVSMLQLEPSKRLSARECLEQIVRLEELPPQADASTPTEKNPSFMLEWAQHQSPTRASLLRERPDETGPNTRGSGPPTITPNRPSRDRAASQSKRSASPALDLTKKRQHLVAHYHPAQQLHETQSPSISEITPELFRTVRDSAKRSILTKRVQYTHNNQRYLECDIGVDVLRLRSSDQRMCLTHILMAAGYSSSKVRKELHKIRDREPYQHNDRRRGTFVPYNLALQRLKDHKFAELPQVRQMLAKSQVKDEIRDCGPAGHTNSARWDFLQPSAIRGGDFRFIDQDGKHIYTRISDATVNVTQLIQVVGLTRHQVRKVLKEHQIQALGPSRAGCTAGTYIALQDGIRVCRSYGLHALASLLGKVSNAASPELSNGEEKGSSMAGNVRDVSESGGESAHDDSSNGESSAGEVDNDRLADYDSNEDDSNDSGTETEGCNDSQTANERQDEVHQGGAIGPPGLSVVKVTNPGSSRFAEYLSQLSSESRLNRVSPHLIPSDTQHTSPASSPSVALFPELFTSLGADPLLPLEIISDM